MRDTGVFVGKQGINIANYRADYESDLDIMVLGISYAKQPEEMIQGRGFDWGVSRTKSGALTYILAEITGWGRKTLSRQKELLSYISDKAGWDYKILLSLSGKVANDVKHTA